VIGPLDVARTFWHSARHLRARREDVVSFQNARLQRLIAHAYDNVPYYRTLLDRHRVRPDQIRTAADLARIPVTTRRDLQTAPPDTLLARGANPRRLIVHRTSGSTGQPLHVRRTWLEERITTAFRARSHRDLGLGVHDLRVRLVLTRPKDRQNWEGPQRLMRALGLFPKVQLDRRLPVSEQLEQLRALGAAAIAGTPGVLVRLAVALARDRPGTIRPRMVLSGGDVLTPAMRRTISESFGAPVYDLYGSYEMGPLAWQCRRARGYHVADDGVVFEVLKDERPAEPGETGEAVVTQLHGFASPFIRYRLGDVVTRGDVPCACGAPFSTLLEVQGRVQDYLPLANGKLFLATELVPLVLAHPTPWVAQHQLVQERPDHVVLRIVPLGTPPDGALATLERETRARLGPGIELTVLLVPEIPLDGDGKFRVARSLVKSFYDGTSP